MKTIKKALSILLVLVTLFSISATSTLSASAATYSESESNDSYSTADTLKLNNSIKGTMNNYDDVDIYKVTTTSSGKLKITFTHTHTDKSIQWYVNIYQYTDGKYVLLSENTISGNSDEKIELPYVGATTSGVYYVRVTNGWYNSVNYEYGISGSFTASSYDCYEKEPNDSYATANTISANKEYSGYMNNYDDVDIYKITTSKNGKLTFTFKHTHTDKSIQWYVNIYQYSDGKYVLLSENTISGNSDEKVELPYVGAQASGVYYVRVTNGWYTSVYHEYSIIAKSSTEPSVDIGTGGNDSGNDNNVTDPGFSFMDVLNAVLDFFKWLFSAVLSFFA